MTTETPAKQREFTGKHMLALCVGCFGIIIAVNIYMAVSAVRTFPGLEVKNSYVASQQFDERKAAQEALGWTVKAELEGQQLVLSITDANGPVEVRELDALLGRPTNVKQDSRPDFVFNGTAYVAPVDVTDGNWDVRLEVIAMDGTEFTQRLKMHVQR